MSDEDKLNVVVKINIYQGRGGYLQALFICTQEELESLYGRDVYFGEILGKHSDIYHTFDKDDLQVLTDDQDFIAKLEKIVGDKTISGYNPLEYLEN